KVPWNDTVVGLSRQDNLFREKKVKSGDTLKYFSYEPTITSVVPITATVKNEEEVDVLRPGKDGKITFVKEKLLRADAVPGKVEGFPGQLPSLTVWLDKNLDI